MTGAVSSLVVTEQAMTPRFSVVLPTHDRPHLLGRAIDSVLRQTFSDFELLVVDDGSNPETQERIASFADCRIRYIEKHRSGVSAARNAGIAAARGALISFLDDDDEYLPGFLERTSSAFAQAPEPGFTWAAIQRVVESPRGISLHDQVLAATSDLAFATRFGASHGLTVRKTHLDATGWFDETMAVCEDIDLLLRLLACDIPYRYIPSVSVRVHAYSTASLSRARNYARDVEDRRRLVEKNSAFLRRHQRLWLHYHDSLAVACYRARRFDEARSTIAAMLKKRPWHLRTWEKLLRFEVLHRLGGTRRA